MNRSNAKKTAATITNQQLLEMFKSAKENITDWTKVSNVNKGMTKGAAWNILARNFDVNKEYHNLAKINMVREFGEFLPKELIPIKPKSTPPINVVHQEPNFEGYNN